ncbi:MAG: dipeptide epimerase [Ignavibacteria bacterium]|nr:dipeptide epimerase [Ignavibacteria bacterium]
MKLSSTTYDLKLKHTFTIARSSREMETVVIVELAHDGIVGFGEASPSRRYGESVESIHAFLSRLELGQFRDPFQLEAILNYVDQLEEGNSAAKASVDIALHDWIGKKLNIPLYQYWGLDKARAPLTSFTIGIDRAEVIEQKVREAEEYPILKIKLGLDNDEEIMKTIRGVTKKTLRVDANEGWRNKEIAVEKIKWLEQEGVEFVEQPMPASDLAGTAWVRERVALPLIADENSIRLCDVPKLQGVFDGINIKLMKCTGLREAHRMISTARACGLKIMMGCMIETSVAISAAAHLSPLIDYADLDGNVLTSNDPFAGVTIENGKLVLPDHPGTGAVRRSA